MKISILRMAVAALLAVAAVLQSVAAGLAPQKSVERSETLTVTPQDFLGNAKTWDFRISLDTHSQDLSDDLLKSAVLLDGTGARHAPVAWEGAAAGGHHREGVLRFNPVSPQPAAIELQITRPGEAAPRSFKWQLR
jgi:hypothetical protein